MLNMSFKTL